VTCTTPVLAGENLVYAGWSPGEDFQMPPFAEVLKQGDKNNDSKLSKEESQSTFIAKFFENQDTDQNGELEEKEWQGLIDFLKNTTNRMIAIKPGAKGDATESHVVWERKKGLPYVSSALAYDGRVYLVKDGGIVSCYDAKSGKPHFEMKRLEATGTYYASPVAAGGRVYFTSLDGKITTINAGDKLDVISTIDLGERTSATPALVGKTFLIRSEKHLWAFAE
jgi:outer membrane protein assembly factor BamB